MKKFSNDKNNFNTSLKNKFNEARTEPSDAVWEGIEGALLKHENVKMQKRAVFYRNIAAAVLLIAAVSIYFNVQDVFNGNRQEIQVVDITTRADKNLSSLGLSVNTFDVISQPQVMGKKTSKENLSIDNVSQTEIEKDASTHAKGESSVKQFYVANDKNQEGNKNQSEGFAGGAVNSDLEDRGSNSIALGTQAKESEFNVPDRAFSSGIQDERKTVALKDESFTKIDHIKPKAIEAKGTNVPELPIKEVSYFAISNLDGVKKESNIAFQSALNVGSGSFNPNANVSVGAPQPGFAALNAPGSAGRTSGNSQVQDQYSAERQIVDDLSNAPIRSNVSMTFGVQFGVHLNERLKIRTGLQYGNYRSSTESSAVIRDINSDQIFPYHGASNATELADGKIVNITSEYNVYNDFQILSVPVIVSYKFLDRKLGIGLVAGATADVLLKNTIRGGDDQISELSFANNENQSYKNLFYSGIAGIEFSYNFSKHYSLSLTPTYKKAFMNITNDNASFNSAPDFLSVDMSFQFTF